MSTRTILGAFLLMSGIGSLGETQTKTEPAAEGDAKRIGELIQKLGSSKEQDRSQAQKELELLGTPALEQLQETAKLGERAADVGRKIEEKIFSAKLLAAKRVRLKVADVSVQEAVEEMAKISGYPIHLQGGPANLKEQKITLDTGEVSFWEALDQLCDKAGLTHQAFHTPGIPGGIINPPQPLPLPVPIKPPLKVPADKPAAEDLPQPKEIDKDKKKDPPRGKGLEGLKLEPNPAPIPPPPAVAPPLQPGQVPPPLAQPVQVQPVPPPMGKPGQIVLRPTFAGTSKAHVSYAGAVRVQLAPAHGMRGEYQLMLSATAEPRLQSFSLIGSPTLTKAEDDQGQKLMAAANPMGVGPGPIGTAIVSPFLPGGMSITFLRLKAGEREAKSLKELTGTLSAQVVGPAGTLVRVDNVMKATGETVKGKRGASLQVASIEKTEDGEFKVRCQIVNPAPEAGPIGAIAHPGMTRNVPDLLDAKGNSFKVVRTLSQKIVVVPGGSPTQELTILYGAQKEQGDPDSLVMHDMRRLTIAIPFAFQNVPLTGPGAPIRPPVPPVPPAPLPPPVQNP